MKKTIIAILLLLMMQTVWGQNDSLYHGIICTINKKLIKNRSSKNNGNPQFDNKISRRESLFYCGIIQHNFDVPKMNPFINRSGIEKYAIFISFIHAYKQAIKKIEKLEIHRLDNPLYEGQDIENAMGVYNNGQLDFVFIFNPGSHKIIWMYILNSSGEEKRKVEEV